MESERKTKIITLSAVIVAVIGLTIAFAAMSRTLRINGSGTMDPANWDIYFENLSSPVLAGEATTSGTPNLATKGAEITNLNATLKQPNDSVTYTVDITNDGDVNAEISQINLPSLTNAQSQLFEFSATYTNEYEHGHTITVGDMLYAGETRNITIVFKYKDITDESLLPNSPEAINLSYSINYVQSNRKVTTTEAQQGGSSNYGEEIASASIGNGITATYYGGTPIAKASNGVQPMAYTDNRVADNVRYQGGTLVISGTGALPDQGEPYYANVGLLLFLADATMEEYGANQSNYVDSSTGNFIFKYNPTNLVVSDGITGIGGYYFYKLHTITSMSLPSSLLTIGRSAFRECTSLTSINIPSSVTTIGENAFRDCESLTSITLNEGLQTIGQGAFITNSRHDCDFIVIPSTVLNIPNDVFGWLGQINSVRFLSGTITFNPGMFIDQLINEIYLPHTVTTLTTVDVGGLSATRDATVYCET